MWMSGKLRLPIAAVNRSVPANCRRVNCPGMTSPRPNPPRRNWLAVWRWPKWTWVVVVPLMLVSYFVSVPIVFYVAKITFNNQPWVLEILLQTYFVPARWCEAHSDFIGDFFDLELEILIGIFGRPWD
jgi:hypothetical protein